MKSAGWRSPALYGMAILLCQPLVACSDSGGAAAQNEVTKKSPAVAVTAPVSADAPLIITFGDSLYAGYQLGPRDGLAPQLQAALTAKGIEARVHNAGVSGDTTAAGLQRLPFVLDNAARRPALVLLGLGGNDMLRGVGPDETRAHLTAMLDELARREIPVLLTGMMAAPNMGRAYSAKFDAIYPDLARRKGVNFYPFILDGVITDPDLMLDDHIHPNAKGVEKIVAALVPLVDQALPEQPGE